MTRDNIGAIAVLARTRWGLDAGRRLVDGGRKIGLVATTKAEEFYGCGVDDYRSFAAQVGACFINASGLSLEDFRAAIARTDCQAAISVNWPMVLGADIIGRFPLGIINAHAGDLPRYRGNACPNWAILNAESHVGLCAHLMEPGALDSGPVVLRDRFAIGPQTYIGDVYDWLDMRIPALLADAVLGLMDGTLRPEPQASDPALALRCYPRRPEDGKIDWRMPATMVHRLVRASSRPFAGAFAFLQDGCRVTIWRASLFEHPVPFCAVPGQILLRADQKPVVACGEGCLRIEEAEMDGVAFDESIMQLGRSLRSRLS